jgi:hypothetical protein
MPRVGRRCLASDSVVHLRRHRSTRGGPGRFGSRRSRRVRLAAVPAPFRPPRSPALTVAIPSFLTLDPWPPVNDPWPAVNDPLACGEFGFTRGWTELPDTRAEGQPSVRLLAGPVSVTCGSR